MRQLIALVVLALICACAPAEVHVAQSAEPAQQSQQSLMDLLKPSLSLKVDFDPDSTYAVGRVLFDVPVDGNSAPVLIRWIEQADAEGLDALVLELNSPGGIVTHGQKIARAIEDTKLPIYCVVDGNAHSMAMYILQSCDVRMMTKRSTLMAHPPHLKGGGTADELRDQARSLRAIGAALAEHVCHRMSPLALSNKACLAKFDNEVWWLTWREAMKVGAVDRVALSPASVTAHLRDKGTLD